MSVPEMHITLTEILLFVWAGMMTVLWYRMRDIHMGFVYTTYKMLSALSEGKAKLKPIVRDGDKGFEIEVTVVEETKQ